MLVHYFQIILNIFYVCQSASWLTSFLKFGPDRDISSSVFYIFLNCFGDIYGMFAHQFKTIPNFLYVCQSASWLTSLLKLGLCGHISSSG